MQRPLLFKTLLIKFLLLPVIMLFTVAGIHAQTGSVAGVIRDKKTQETIVGANVVIKGTTLGAISDLDGRFTLANLKKGTYTLVVSFISYTTITLENIRIDENTPELSIELEESIASLEGVTVSANRVTHTDLSMINSIKKAEVVVSGISSQQISKSQDKDAAEVVKRIPGVTVTGENYIRIRGLGERYNFVQLNDAPAPSMEADVRSFSFDIVPSSLIDRILIFKSPSADLPGDFSGGVVKIFTKSIPEESFLEVNYGTGYRQGSSMQEFLGNETGSTNWTGFNDGAHDLPADFPKDLRLSNPAELMAAGQSLPNSWVPVSSNTGLNQSLTITGALKLKSGKATIGNVTSLLYSNNKTVYEVERYDYMQYDAGQEKSSILYNFLDREYTHNIRAGLLHNWAVKFNENHSVEFRNFYNQVSKAQYVLRTGIHYDFNYVPENHSFDQLYRGIYTGQLNGTHKFAAQQLTFDWSAGYNRSYRDQPDYRRYRSDVDTVENTRTLYIPLGSASSYFLGRFFSTMDEESMSGSVGLTWKPLSLKGILSNMVLKAGVDHDDKNREFSARNIGYVRTTQSDPNLQYLTIDQLFQPENINNTSGIRIDEQSNAADSYHAANKQTAVYGSVNMQPIKRIGVIAGVRLEKNDQLLGSGALQEDIENNSLDILPSVNLNWQYSEKMQVRAAYGVTVNRPEFRELAPFGFYDFSYNLVKKGNKDLKNARIHNMDLRWEYYPEASEIISLGVFYKKFIDPIETQFVPGGGSGGIKDFSFANVEGAESMGVEAEVRKSLKGLTNSNFINDLSIIFNGALIKSKVQLGDSLVRQSSDRPMQGQSPYILNMGLSYRNMQHDLQVNLLYNVAGKYIFSIGFDVYPDIYQMPRNLIDLTINKGLGRHFELKAGISDLLNNPVLLLQDANNDGKYEAAGDQVIQRYMPGTTFTLGISYSL